MQPNSTNAASCILHPWTEAAACVRPEFLQKANPKTVPIQKLTQLAQVCMSISI